MGRAVQRTPGRLISGRSASGRPVRARRAPRRRTSGPPAPGRPTPITAAVAGALALTLAGALTACSGGSGRPVASSGSGSPLRPGRTVQPSPSARPSGPSSASSAVPTAPSRSASSGPTGSAIWHPVPRLTWQWQLTEPVDTTVNAQVYDIDSADNSAAVVAKLHAAGRKAICYVNAGAHENFRQDASAFPAAVLGRSDGWPGEKWLDIRQVAVLRPIMAARFAVCAQKGFDAVEADNVDGYENDSGFPLTGADQLAYNRMLAGLAHADGLAIGLKNDLDQVPQLLSSFDFAIDEQCAEYSECAELEPFVKAGKAVFEAEYNLPLSQFCAQSAALGFSAILKDTDLDPARQACAGG